MKKLVDVLSELKGKDFLLSIGNVDSRNRVRVYSAWQEKPLATFFYQPPETPEFYSEIKEAEKQGYRLNYSARAVFLNGVGFVEWGPGGHEEVSDETCKKVLEALYRAVKKAKPSG